MKFTTIAIKGAIVSFAIFSTLSALPVPLAAGGASAEPELLMRSGPGSSYRIPQGSSWSSATPVLNNAGVAALAINAVAPTFNPGVWQGDLAEGDIIHVSDEDDALYSDVDNNLAGDAVWRRAFSSADGIMKYSADSDSAELLTNAPIGANAWTSVQINDTGLVAYRAGFSGGNAWTSFDGTATIRLAETGVDNNSPWAFLFSPSLNQHGLMAGKAAWETFSQNRLISVTAEGSLTILVDDHNLDSESPFSNFDNSVGLNDQGQVVFVGDAAKTGRGVYVVDAAGENLAEYALPGQNGLDSLEFFAPVINNNAMVAFRGFHQDGRRAIWRADGQTLEVVAAQDDVVETDIGPARLRSPDAVGGPNFGGTVAINDQGDIAFVSLLTDPDDSTISYGRGLFIVRGDVPDPVFQDRFESDD